MNYEKVSLNSISVCTYPLLDWEDAGDATGDLLQINDSESFDGVSSIEIEGVSQYEIFNECLRLFLIMVIGGKMKKLIYLLFGILVITFIGGCSLLTSDSDDDDDDDEITYTITIATRGAISDEIVVADVQEAAEGDIVTLTATLNANRFVEFHSESGNIFSLPSTGDDQGHSDFTMPASDVTVMATFYYSYSKISLYIQCGTLGDEPCTRRFF